MTGINSEFWIFRLKKFLTENGLILADLQLPKAKIKKPWATAERDKIPKMGQIICFYDNTHVLKSEPGYFVTFSHR